MTIDCTSTTVLQVKITSQNALSAPTKYITLEELGRIGRLERCCTVVRPVAIECTGPLREACIQLQTFRRYRGLAAIASGDTIGANSKGQRDRAPAQ